MSNPLSRVFHRQSLREDIRRSLESGVGLYRGTWRVESDQDRLADALIAWCRDVLGEIDRPYGLDFVTLALTVQDEHDVEMAGANCGILRPQDFYSNGRAENQVHTLLRHWANARMLARCQDGKLSAVLFSWGDLTKELLLTA